MSGWSWTSAADDSGVVLRLPGPRAAADAIARPSAVNAGQARSLARRGGVRWLGVETVKEADEVLSGARAWTEGLDAFKEALGACEGSMAAMTLPTTRRRRRYGEDGGELDADRLYAGALDVAWRRCERVRGNAPRAVRLVVDVCGHCGEVAGDMVWPGAAAVALGERLSAAGRRVEVEAVFLTAGFLGAGGAGLVSCVVKASHEPWDQRRALAWAAFPGAFRGRLMRAAYSCGSRVSRGMGAPIHNASRFAAMTGEELKGVIFVPALRDATAAAAFCKRALVEAGATTGGCDD